MTFNKFQMLMLISLPVCENGFSDSTNSLKTRVLNYLLVDNCYLSDTDPVLSIVLQCYYSGI